MRKNPLAGALAAAVLSVAPSSNLQNPNQTAKEPDGRRITKRNLPNPAKKKLRRR